MNTFSRIYKIKLKHSLDSNIRKYLWDNEIFTTRNPEDGETTIWVESKLNKEEMLNFYIIKKILN